MRNISMFACFIVPVLSATIFGPSPHIASTKINPVRREVSTLPRDHFVEMYGKLPVAFEANEGQSGDSVKFLARVGGHTLFLTATEAVLSLRKQGAHEMGDDRKREAPIEHLRAVSTGPIAPKSLSGNRSQTVVVRMKLIGANPNARISGLEQLPGKSNYLIGNDPAKWHTNVPNFARVKYQDVYPGIDLVYYGNQGQLEYDFLVSPGANPSAIELAFEGQEKLGVDSAGSLVLEAGDGSSLRLHKPLVYQDTASGRREIASGFVLKNPHEVGFEVARYDVSKRLVIDPILSYSTYLGGGGPDRANAIAVDASGSTYVTGVTYSTDFPTTSGVLQTTLSGVSDIFVAKLTGSGNALAYSTYIGGASYDISHGVAVDGSGNAYVTGETGSLDFPTVNPFQRSQGGAFVLKLNPTGTALVYSTYLASAQGHAIAVDLAGNAYVTGNAASGFPTTPGAFQTTPGRETYVTTCEDAFVTKLNPLGSGLVYSTYLGGDSCDIGNGIAVDSAGSAYVTGSTGSANFPITSGAFQLSYGGGGDAFVAKLNPAGTALAYSTYLGGSE